jgi:pentatricopeptide repeat protein
MKKRAQFPDAHTYTIIFRGCAMHPQPSSALAKVLLIYHSMMSEKSPIKPNVIHMNAILKMCARAQNIEAMLSIVAEMPTRGIGAPNNLSYTTIFNALRLYAVNDLRGTLTPMQKRQNVQNLILDARRIWADVSKRWRQGEIWIDEELVSAMGRLLLLGGRQDINDILSLIEQTMNIPRQVPRGVTGGPQEIDSRAIAKQRNSSQESKKEASSPEPYNDDQPIAVTAIDDFQPVELSARHSPSPAGYAKPGQNSLSLVLQALLEMKLKEPASKYWQIFTTEHNVKPDQANFHAYLRILRVARASTETVNVLLRMPMQDLKHTAFRIAMATCRRDKLNRGAFANAGKLLDLMQTALREPDIPFLEEYLELAITAPAYSKEVFSSGPKDPSKLEQGKQILRALDRLNPSFLNLKAALHFEDPELKKKSLAERTEFVDSILSLTKKMISSYDLLMDKAMVPRDSYGPLTAQRNKLTAFVTRHKFLKPRSHSKQEKPAADNVVKWSADMPAVLANSKLISDPQPSDPAPSGPTPARLPIQDYKIPQRSFSKVKGPKWQWRLSTAN